ncbi:MAG: AAA family ATPase [Alicyclobacillaceae bacterium]|nr:AAA family ATPase [Alicyclobacillaceae bacterium]
MRIQWWRIGRFGRWTGVESGPLPPGLVVIYGPNEAGKTTLLQFIRAMMFGEAWRDRSPYWPEEGSVAGALGVRLEDGRNAVVERYADRRRREFSLLFSDGTRAGEEQWRALLGGVDRFVYDNLFAFGLGELERPETLQDRRLAARLYSAGAGLRGADVAAVEQDLLRRMEQRYKVRGKRPKINDLLREWRECEAQIRRLGHPGAEYEQVAAALARCDAEERELAEDRRRLRERREELARIQQLRKLWEARERTAAEWAELSELPDVDPETVTRIDGLAERVKELRASLEREETRLARWREEREGGGEEDVLWRERERVMRALEGRTREAALDEERARLVREREELAAREADLVRRLGPVAGGEASEGVPTPARAEAAALWRAVEREERRWRDAVEACARREMLLEQAVSDLRRLEERVREEEARDLGDPPGERREWLRRLREIRSSRLEEEARIEALDAARRTMEAARDTSHRRVWAVLLAVGAGAAVAVAAVAAGLPLPAGAALFAAAVAAAFFLARTSPDRSRRRSDWERQRAQRQEALERRIREEAEWARRLFGREDWSEEDAGRLEREWEDALRRQAALSERRRQAEELRREVEAHREVLESERRKLDQIAEEREEALRVWRRWLEERGFPPEWDGARTEAALEWIDRLSDIRRRKREIEGRLGELEAEREAWRRELRSLCELGGVVLRRRDGWESEACLALEERLAAAQDRLRRAEQRARMIRDGEERMRETAGLVNRLEEELVRERAALGAESEEEWRRLRPRFLRRRECREQRRTLEEQMRRLAEEIGRPDLLREVPGWDGDRLAGALSELEREEDRIHRRMRELGEQRSELEARRRELEGGRSLSWWLQRREETAERLRREAEGWAVDALALYLLTRTKERYERERQPGVMKRASTIFAALTAGRYRRIGVPLDGGPWYAEDAGGRRWPLEQLSRGTAEQLYLSVRLASLEELQERGVRLPVMMDDVLVNFDPERRRRAVRVLAEMARDRQIFYLTCHPEAVADFRSAVPGLPVLDWSENGGGAGAERRMERG